MSTSKSLQAAVETFYCVDLLKVGPSFAPEFTSVQGGDSVTSGDSSGNARIEVGQRRR
jgi:hypothetical protein